MRRIALTALLVALLAPASADATFPGDNGKIAFVRGNDIWTMNADGTGQVNLTNDAALESQPAWSPDGTKIAFKAPSSLANQIWVMNADGTGVTHVSNDTTGDKQPAWSPDGARIAFLSRQGGPVFSVMNADGTNRQTFGSYTWTLETEDWSPAGDKLAFASSCFNPGGGSGGFVGTIATVPGSTVTPLTQPNGCAPFGTDLPFLDDHPSWSPDAQRILFDRQNSHATQGFGLYTIAPDGTNLEPVKVDNSSVDPVWSPDGSKIAYTDDLASSAHVHVMNADTTGDVDIGNGNDPDWQSIPGSGTRANLSVHLTDAPDPVPAGDELHYTATVANGIGPNDATGVMLTVNLPATVFYVSATPTQGSCSQAAQVVTCNLGTLTSGASASVDIDVEPQPVTQNTQITASAGVTANEPDPFQANNSDSETTTVTPGGYARPRGATPLRASLVPAYKQCGTGDATLQHGAPLSYPSCGNPQQTSGYLTIGTPDANMKGANSTGFVLYQAIGEQPINPNNGDQSDVKVDVSITDVRKKSDLSDYTGEVQVDSALRVTDHDNGAGGFTSATMQDGVLDYTVPCAGTASTTVGSTCAISTTADAVMPGSVKELRRAIWQLGQVRVLDGGADGSVVTADNTLFAVQGVFAP